MLDATIRKQREDWLNEGKREGIKEGIKGLLTARFGKEASSLDSWLDSVSDIEKLRLILHRAGTVERLQDVPDNG